MDNNLDKELKNIEKICEDYGYKLAMLQLENFIKVVYDLGYIPKVAFDLCLNKIKDFQEERI